MAIAFSIYNTSTSNLCAPLAPHVEYNLSGPGVDAWHPFQIAIYLVRDGVRPGSHFTGENVFTPQLNGRAKTGVRHIGQVDKPVSQSDLNKIEWVMQYETMPPTRYTALHWAGKVSDEERAEILAWIAKQRAEYYASNDIAPEHRNEPVQPIPQKLPTDAQKVALGFALYHDPRLSADSTISCAHCHALNAGGVDGRKTSIGVGGAVGPINAPTVFNSVFNVEQFWDGRAATLQDQAGGPPLNPIEMASKSWDEIIAKLEKDPQLKTQFLEVYPQGFSGENITDAIAEFEKTLITPDSPFDRWLRGDENALTAQQKKGYQLFKDNKCATCHGGIILGGRSFEPLGLKKDFNFGEITAADIGRMNVTKEERDKLRQKVPGLRNVALTAPYFHRGDVPTLDGAVKLMLRYQVGKELPQEDVDDIVAFLKSKNLTGFPSRVPMVQAPLSPSWKAVINTARTA